MVTDTTKLDKYIEQIIGEYGEERSTVHQYARGELITTEEKWIKNASSLNYKPEMECPEGHIVTNTSIANFVNHNRNCYTCKGNISWSERYEEIG